MMAASVHFLSLIFYVLVSTVSADFLSSTWQVVQTSATEAAQEIEKDANKVGDVVVDVSEKAASAAVDAAVQKSGKCEGLVRDRRKISPTLSSVIAEGLQVGQDNPSVDVSACHRQVRYSLVAYVHHKWHDITGLSDKIIGGLSGEWVSHICGPPFMVSLRSHEPIRKSNPGAYRERIQQVLRETVITDEWVQKQLAAHCGGLQHVARFFSAARQVHMGSWSYSLSSVAAAVGLSAVVLFATLLALLAVWRRHQQRTGVAAHALLGCDGISGKAGVDSIGREVYERHTDCIE